MRECGGLLSPIQASTWVGPRAGVERKEEVCGSEVVRRKEAARSVGKERKEEEMHTKSME